MEILYAEDVYTTEKYIDNYEDGLAFGSRNSI